MSEDVDDMTIEEYLEITLESAKTIRDNPEDTLRVKIEIQFIIDSLVDMLEARWITDEDNGPD